MCYKIEGIHAKMTIRSYTTMRTTHVNVAKNGRGHFIPPKILLEVSNYWEEFRTKFTIYRSKDIGGIKLKKKYRGPPFI